MKYHQGLFRPHNPDKYAGNPSRIIYRSNYEFKFMRWLDSHPDVISWQSEEFFIPYQSPIDGRYHRYFPDFKFTKRDKNNLLETVVVEVKPASQAKPPKKNVTKITRRHLQEQKTYAINIAKWNAAEKYCADRGYKFSIITEKELGLIR